MIRQIVALVAFSVAVILAMSYVHQGLQLLLKAHEWVAQILTDVFSVGQAGNLVRGLIALLTIPVIVSLIPAIIYWMIRRHWFPYFMQIIWIVWFIQTGALIIMSKAVV